MKKAGVAACITGALMLFSSAVVSPSYAGTGKGIVYQCEKKLRKLFPKTRVDMIRKSPIKGICELWLGTNVIYFYPEKGYLIIGNIYSSGGKNITELSREKVMAENIRNLNLKNTIKWGKGKIKVVLFTDPDCPFCAKVEKFLLTSVFKNKLNVHIFLYPLTSIHPHAEEHALNVLCSKDPVKTLLSYASHENPEIKCSEKDREKAKARLKEMKKSGDKAGIRGTPLVVVGNRVIFGADLEKIMEAITEQERNIK